jgi:18S rRNA (guanine1575-N7)-methyltransferase
VEDARKRGGRKGVKSSRRDEIAKTKARLERKGRVVKATTKYTGRKRRIQF